MNKLLLSAAIFTIFFLLSIHDVYGSWYAPQGLSVDGRVNELVELGDSLIASTSAGLYYTTDGGATWNSPGFYGNNASMFAISGDDLLSASGSWFYVSLNRGRTWSYWYLNDGITIYCMTAHNDTLFAGTNSGVYRVTDSANNWVNMQSGLLGMYVGSIITVGNTIFAGTYGGGIYRSTDEGSHWTAANTGLSDLSVDVITAFGDTLYCATDSNAFRSTDGGRTWARFTNGMQGKQVFCFAQNSGTVYAGTDSGVYASSGGGNWSPVNNGFHDTVNAIAPMGGNIYAGTNNGVYFSSALGNMNWTPVPLSLSGIEVDALASFGGGLIAVAGNSIYRSTDNGDSWFWSGQGYSGYSYNSIIAISGGTILIGTPDSGIYRSTDGGASWAEANNSDSGVMNRRINALYVSDSAVYAGTGLFLYVTTDNGAHWKHINSIKGTEGITLSGGNIFAMQEFNVIERSSDGGLHWDTVMNGLQSPYLYSISSTGNTIFVSADNGMYRSTNNGAQWIPVNKGLNIIERAAFAVNDSDIFMGSAYNGVFVTTNNGTTWVPINDGLNDDQIAGLTINNGYIFAGTYSDGVYRRPLYEILNGVDETPANIPSGITLANYPNPFDNTTTIEYSLPQHEAVTLNVYDALGRKMETLINGESEAGAHNIRFSAQSLQPGVYFYRLTAGSEIKTGTMAIVR